MARPKKTDLRIGTVGWREWVALPDLGIDMIKAKIDTGARTSALHAFHVEPFIRDGRDMVRFRVHPVQRFRHPDVLCEAPLIGEREVISSNGQHDMRFVIATSLRIGTLSWRIEMTLADRDEMGFRMLLGRKAMAGRLLVDPGRSYRFGRPEGQSKPIKERRKANR